MGMLDLHIEGTNKTPTIIFHENKHLLEIHGDSIVEDPYEFYMPLFHWLEIAEENPLNELTVDFKIEYFNTSSSKCILDILKRMEGLKLNKNTDVTINWYYEIDDEDMLDIGKEFQQMLKVPFKLFGYVE